MDDPKSTELLDAPEKVLDWFASWTRHAPPEHVPSGATRLMRNLQTATRNAQDGVHACNDGWVSIAQVAFDPETGEEVEESALYLCEGRREAEQERRHNAVDGEREE
jgi:hypothetical protein